MNNIKILNLLIILFHTFLLYIMVLRRGHQRVQIMGFDAISVTAFWLNDKTNHPQSNLAAFLDACFIYFVIVSND